jgi:NitT/TauT family transport system ATP-binding protein
VGLGRPRNQDMIASSEFIALQKDVLAAIRAGSQGADEH